MKRGFLNKPASKGRTPAAKLANRESVKDEQSIATKASQITEKETEKPSTAVPATAMPSGKLDTRLPQGYVPGSFSASTRCMLIPPRPSPSTYDPDGHTACVFYHPASLEEKFIFSSAPKFPAPIAKTPSPRCKVAPSKLGGLGLFATVDMKLNDLVYSERPLALTPTGLGLRGPANAFGPGTTTKQKELIQLAEENIIYTKEMKQIMKEEDFEAFMELDNSHENDGSGDVLGRLRTNGFGVSLHKGREQERDGLLQYTAVYKTFSRVNHSCSPNCRIRFYKPQFAGELRAVRDIKAGEELLTAYCDVNYPYEVRKKALDPYGFGCTCPHCSILPSGGGRQTIDRLRAKFTMQSATLEPLIQKIGEGQAHALTPQDLQRLKSCDQALAEMDKWGLETLTCYEVFLQGKAMTLLYLGQRAQAAPVFKQWVAREEAVNGNLGARRMLDLLQV